MYSELAQFSWFVFCQLRKSIIYFIILKKNSRKKRLFIYLFIYLGKKEKKKKKGWLWSEFFIKAKENPFAVDGRGDHCPKQKHRFIEIWLFFFFSFTFFWGFFLFSWKISRNGSNSQEEEKKNTSPPLWPSSNINSFTKWGNQDQTGPHNPKKKKKKETVLIRRLQPKKVSNYNYSNRVKIRVKTFPTNLLVSTLLLENA